MQDEPLRHAFTHVLGFYGEGAALQMRGAEHATNLEFLAYDERLLLAHDTQLADVSTRTFLYNLHSEDWSELHLQVFTDEVMCFLLRKLLRPFVEVAGFEVVIIKHLTQNLGVVRVAERVFDRAQIGNLDVLPAVLILVRLTSATLSESRIANLSIVHEYLTSSRANCLSYSGIAGSRDALITLAVVIGTDVEDGVVFAVVPTDTLAFAFDESEEGRSLLGMLLSPLHLGIEPTSRDDGGGFQELERATALHLATDDACQVVLDGQDVDGDDFVLIDHELQYALEGLRFLALPMELLTDCDAMKRERGCSFVLRPERQFLINIISPTNAAIRIFRHLLACHLRTFRMIRTVHAEANDCIFHDADGNFLIDGGQVVLLLLVLRNSLFRLVRQLCDNGL